MNRQTRKPVYRMRRLGCTVAHYHVDMRNALRTALGLGLIFLSSCGRRSGTVRAREWAAHVVDTFVAEAARDLPSGQRVLIYAADPPSEIPGIPRLGQLCAAKARQLGLGVRRESGEWPDPPLIQLRDLEEWARRHGPLHAIWLISVPLHLDGPPPRERPPIFVLSTRPDPRLERWVHEGWIAGALVPREQTTADSALTADSVKFIRRGDLHP